MYTSSDKKKKHARWIQHLVSVTDHKCGIGHRKKITDSQFGYFTVFKEYPQKSQIWKSETSPTQGTWLGIPCLGRVSLCQIWDFYWYSLNNLKYPKMGIRYFFLWVFRSFSTRYFGIYHFFVRYCGIGYPPPPPPCPHLKRIP